MVFYHLYYQHDKNKDHSPLRLKEIAAKLPTMIENTLRDYPQDWLCGTAIRSILLITDASS
ncbi:MAG: hypothetical protein ACLR17_13580 [Enterobacteriaceae bacterium]